METDIFSHLWMSVGCKVADDLDCHVSERMLQEVWG